MRFLAPGTWFQVCGTWYLVPRSSENAKTALPKIEFPSEHKSRRNEIHCKGKQYKYSKLPNNPSGLNSNPSGRIFDTKSDKISTFSKKSGSNDHILHVLSQDT